MIWVALYGSLTVACCTIVIEAYRRDPVALIDLRTAAIILAASFVISLVTGLLLTHPERVYAPMDLLCGAFFLFQWRMNLKGWALLLVSWYAFQIAFHSDFIQVGDYSAAARTIYYVKLNVLYVIELCTITVPAFVAIIERRKGSISL